MRAGAGFQFPPAELFKHKKIMITVNAAEIFLSENSVCIELSNSKKYKILLKDYENLPFECRSDSLLDSEHVEFLKFLSMKRNIYRSAISKVALTDIPKKQLFRKLYFAVYQNSKKNNTEADTETLKDLCSLVCDEFEELGYINDRRYAEDKSRYLKEYKKYGNGRIKEYLYQKGIASDIINETLEDEFFSDENADLENMRNLLKKKYGENLNRLDKSDRNGIQKAIHMLVRNGYKYQDARKAFEDFADHIENIENEDYENEF
jgi:SOS response regulatory protein OraA/RecX